MKRLHGFLLVLTLVLAPMASVYAANWYVATNGTGNGTSWANATNSIQGAINASAAPDTVWVSNGVYQTGGVTNFPTGTVLTNRVAIYKAITVRSANNDPTNTIIRGAWDPATNGNGPAAVRCVWMTNGSTLIGFTLTNGATLAATTADGYGGGVYCQSINTVISNCVLTGNSAYYFGGGAMYGTLFNCTLSNNSAINNEGGGAYFATLYNCTIVENFARWRGGGVRSGNLFNCTLAGNSTGPSGALGGGAAHATLYNCMIVENFVNDRGGGAYDCTLYNCTIVSNSATSWGGGVREGTLINSIVYFNSAPSGSNWSGTIVATNTCTAPAVSGPGNITDNPLFVDTNAANYRLSVYSPALNAGTNLWWMTVPTDVRSKDLDGQRRIDRFSQQVDMGCYELMPRGTMFIGY